MIEDIVNRISSRLGLGTLRHNEMFDVAVDEIGRAIAAEREACAEVVETQSANYEISEESQRLLLKAAIRIRKRGN